MNIRESLHEVLQSKRIFGHQFYDVFFTNSPDVKQYFKGVNFERQAVLLTMALVVIEKQYSHPYAATQEYLRYLGTKHHDWKIPKHLYADWKTSMLQTLARFHGEQWSESLEKEWGQAIDGVIEIMFQGYEQHFTV